MIERLAIRCSGSDQVVSNLSGGNQQKVALAKWLLSEAKVLILDEPTRGVDVGARQEIYEIIRELAASGIAIIIVFLRYAGSDGNQPACDSNARGTEDRRAEMF